LKLWRAIAFSAATELTEEDEKYRLSYSKAEAGLSIIHVFFKVTH